MSNKDCMKVITHNDIVLGFIKKYVDQNSSLLRKLDKKMQILQETKIANNKLFAEIQDIIKLLFCNNLDIRRLRKSI